MIQIAQTTEVCFNKEFLHINIIFETFRILSEVNSYCYFERIKIEMNNFFELSTTK